MDLVIRHKNSLRIGGLIAATGLLYGGYLQHIIMRYIFFPYLIFDSLKYLSMSKSKKKDNDEYIKKWICYSSYIVIESFTDMIFPYTPLYIFYNFGKLILLYLTIRKQTNYQYFYNCIKKFYDSNKKIIDKYIVMMNKYFYYYANAIEQLVLTNLYHFWSGMIDDGNKKLN